MALLKADFIGGLVRPGRVRLGSLNIKNENKKKVRATKASRAVAILRYEEDGQGSAGVSTNPETAEDNAAAGPSPAPPSRNRRVNGGRVRTEAHDTLTHPDASPADHDQANNGTDTTLAPASSRELGVQDELGELVLSGQKRKNNGLFGRPVLPTAAEIRRNKELIWPLLTAIRSLPNERAFCEMGLACERESFRHLSAYSELDLAYYKCRALRESLRPVNIADMQSPAFPAIRLQLQRLCALFLGLFPLASGRTLLSENRDKLREQSVVAAEIDGELRLIYRSPALQDLKEELADDKANPERLRSLVADMSSVLTHLGRACSLLSSKTPPRLQAQVAVAVRRWGLYIEKNQAASLFEDEMLALLEAVEKPLPASYHRVGRPVQDRLLKYARQLVDGDNTKHLRTSADSFNALNDLNDINAETTNPPAGDYHTWAASVSESLVDLGRLLGISSKILFPRDLSVVFAKEAPADGLCYYDRVKHSLFHPPFAQASLAHEWFHALETLGDGKDGSKLGLILDDDEELKESQESSDSSDSRESRAWRALAEAIFRSPRGEFLERKRRELGQLLQAKKESEAEYYSWSAPSHPYQRQKRRLEQLAADIGPLGEATEVELVSLVTGLGLEVDRLGCQRELVRRRANHFHAMARDVQKEIEKVESSRPAHTVSRFVEDARRIDQLKRRREPFWASAPELGARAFETYLGLRMRRARLENNFLLNPDRSLAGEAKNNLLLSSAYPVEGGEVRRLEAAFLELFAALSEK